MNKLRINYWTCSKFANFVRGSKKPSSLTSEDWNKWHKETKEKNPWRYWLAEDFLKILQDICYFPYDIYRTIKSYIRNRFIDKIHYLKTDLEPGQYYDLDTRILHGLFNELVDFVEIELASLMRYYKDKNYKFKKGRCVQAGLDHLDWAISLTYGNDFNLDKKDPKYNESTPQAKSSKKILELYNWWKNRPNRVDPFDVHKKENDKNWYKKVNKMENFYEKEDTKMLIELIKIRNSLWT